MGRGGLGAGVVVLVLAAAFASAAQAATISASSTAITITSGAESENFFASQSGGTVTFESSSVALTATGSCTQTSPTIVECPVEPGITFNAGGGDDQAAFTGTAIPVTAHGNAGNDALTGGTGNDALSGDEDNDFLDSGPSGTDTLDGGDGSDVFNSNSLAGVTIRGGAGTDAAEFWAAPAAATVSLDDVANDVVGAGAPGNVHADVENLAGSAFADTLKGSSAGNRLTGGQGADDLEGAGGTDQYDAGEGDDMVHAADGLGETVDCGNGADTAALDDLDTATACETAQVTFFDHDGDGSLPPADCNNADPAIHPGATDTPGNGVDEDCSGADAIADSGPSPGTGGDPGPDPTVTPLRTNARAKWGWRTKGGGTRVISARIDRLPRAGQVDVFCRGKGKGCPFKHKRLKGTGRAIKLTKLFKGKRLRAGVTVELRLTEPGKIGRVQRWRTRAGKRKPKLTSLCLPPGTSKPVRC